MTERDLELSTTPVRSDSLALESGATVVLDASMSRPAGAEPQSTEASIRRHTFVSGLARLRRALLYGSVLWPAFAPVDLAVHQWVQPLPLEWFLFARVAPVPLFLLLAYLSTPARCPSSRWLTAYELAAFGSASLSLGYMIATFRGLHSPYACGLTLLVLFRAVFLPRSARQALPSIVLCVLSYPAILGAAALVSSEIAHQWTLPAARGIFALHMSNLALTACIALLGSHTAAALRRDVFEARAVGRYRLLRRIGQGAMGEVWAASHPRLRQPVAVKLIANRLAENPQALQRFEREVEAMAQLRHPNTVRILDYGVTADGVWYYAMELLEGDSLDRVVDAAGPIAPVRAARITLQAARALAEAHRSGIVHRDVKPANVFLLGGGAGEDLVKVLDFGVAKNADSTADLTVTGAVIGTPRYMSPEAAQGLSVDARSDVYGLGGLLYFLLTGSAPFLASERTSVLVEQIIGAVERPSSRLGTEVPRELEDIVLRALAKEPDLRYADAGAMADALAAWLRVAGAAAA